MTRAASSPNTDCTKKGIADLCSAALKEIKGCAEDAPLKIDNYAEYNTMWRSR